MHEIVTLQFGSRANYLGTHFWNAQVSKLMHDLSLACIQRVCHLELQAGLGDTTKGVPSSSDDAKT